MTFAGRHHSEESKKKTSMSMRGREFSQEHKNRIKHAVMAEKNHMWKGDDVGLCQLHDWVRVRLPKPKSCAICKMIKISYDLANKGIYNRDLNNWQWLCRSCHMKSDGRLTKLHNK